jgi:putative ABC transport system permease protein
MGHVQDLRFAARAFARGRSTTALAVTAFALGIGATTAVFSIFNSVLLAPLPYPDAHQLVLVYDTQPACDTCPASFPKYHDWREHNRVFSAIGGSTPWGAVLTGSGDPERVAGVAVTASLVDVLGVGPALGRWFSEEEDQPSGPRVVVLSDGFWQRRLGGSTGVLGQPLILNGEPHEVIGVMPPGFAHRNADVIRPLQLELDPATRGSHFLQTYARLAPGVTLERAQAEMRALGQSLAEEFRHNHGIDVQSLHEAVVGGIRAPLQVLLGAVFLVLLIACVNVANLLLAASLARRRELAIRVALGAGRSHLARQLTAEALLLAAVGGGVGVLLATWAVRTFVALAANLLPRSSSITVDGRVLLFTAAVSLLVGVGCGLWPVLRLRLGELAAAVREGDTRVGSGRGRAFGAGLAMTEIALACALLTGAGLLVKNLMLLQARDTGLDTARVMAFDVAAAGPRYEEPAAVRAFYAGLIERLRAHGDIESVGAISHLPMYRFGTNGEMSAEGGNPWGPGEAPLVEYRWVAGDYFDTVGIRLLKGRLFDERDRQDATQVIVVSQALAEKYWPGQDPVGRRLAPGFSQNWWEVIGVVSDVRSFGLTRTTPYEMYRTIDQQPNQSMTIVARVRGGRPAAILPAGRQIVASLDPYLAVTMPQTLEDVVAGSVGRPRLLSAMASLFGVLAGLLAMVGVYGVAAHNVRRQRREYGIRLALGAAPAAVRALVLKRGAVVAAGGVSAGALVSLFLTRTLQSMLDDVSPLDPMVFAASSVIVLLVVLVASYVPARWAGRVDPMVVLRDA